MSVKALKAVMWSSKTIEIIFELCVKTSCTGGAFRQFLLLMKCKSGQSISRWQSEAKNLYMTRIVSGFLFCKILSNETSCQMKPVTFETLVSNETSFVKWNHVSPCKSSARELLYD